MDPRTRPIGVFDSGLGGISVLRACTALLPQEDFLFFGDSANAPYGEKSLAQVQALTMAGIRRLLEQGVKALVAVLQATTTALTPCSSSRCTPAMVSSWTWGRGFSP